MKHNGAILYQLYLHVGYYRKLRKKVCNRSRCTLHCDVFFFCVCTLPVRQNNALNKANLFYSLCAHIQGHLKVSILT